MLGPHLPTPPPPPPPPPPPFFPYHMLNNSRPFPLFKYSMKLLKHRWWEDLGASLYTVVKYTYYPKRKKAPPPHSRPATCVNFTPR